MPKGGPIIIVGDDHDDQELLKEVFEKLNIPNLIRFFSSCFKALDYLLTTIERPFLITSDFNLPAMNGLDFRMKINENESLKRKGIPFVFLTTAHNNNCIAKAYEISVQGYFVKQSTVKDLTEMARMIIEYWKICSRPDTT